MTERLEWMPDARAAIARTLTPEQMGERRSDFAALAEQALLASERIEGGLRLWFRPEERAEVERLAEAESECCAFFGFVVQDDDGSVRLDWTAPPEASDIIEAQAEALGVQ